MEAAEISLVEKDQRIGELDRLIERMEKVTNTALGPDSPHPCSPGRPAKVQGAFGTRLAHPSNL